MKFHHWTNNTCSCGYQKKGIGAQTRYSNDQFKTIISLAPVCIRQPVNIASYHRAYRITHRAEIKGNKMMRIRKRELMISTKL